MATYNKAAELDPAHARIVLFNEGAVLTNAGKADEAIAVWDKVIAADPTKAEAYYQKGLNLLAKMTIGKDGKTIAPEGTAAAFQKYLELAPTGRYAQAAKDLLTSIGAPVETGFGKEENREEISSSPVPVPGTGAGYCLQLPRSLTYLSFALAQIRATFTA